MTYPPTPDLSPDNPHPYNRATPYGLLCPHNITEFEGCPDCEGGSMEPNSMWWQHLIDRAAEIEARGGEHHITLTANEVYLTVLSVIDFAHAQIAERILDQLTEEREASNDMDSNAFVEGEGMAGNYVFEASKKMDMGLAFTTGIILGHLTKAIDPHSALQDAAPIMMKNGNYTNHISVTVGNKKFRLTVTQEEGE